MENEQKKKQSDALRQKADMLDNASTLIDVLVIICAAAIIIPTLTHQNPSYFIIIGTIAIAACFLISANIMLSAKAESYKTQADILDVLTDIRDGKRPELNADNKNKIVE